MVKDSAYTDEQTKFNNKEGNKLLMSLKDWSINLSLLNFIGIDFGDGFQPTGPYESDSDEFELDLTED